MIAVSPAAGYTVRCGNRLIRFRLRYAKRKTLGISVYPDGGVEVAAPLRVPLSEIERVVCKRSGWILEQQRRLAKLSPPVAPRRYCEDERFHYLGVSYQLRLERGRPARVRLSADELCVRMADPENPERVRKVLRGWYRARAALVFGERLADSVNRVAEHGIPAPHDWRLRWMSRRWGSCSSNGRIVLNPQLVTAPVSCIDYVIVHELCHLIEHNHSAAYYRLLTQVMPDWRERRRYLNEQQTLLLD